MYQLQAFRVPGPGTVLYRRKGVFVHAALVAGPGVGFWVPVVSLGPEGFKEEFWSLSSGVVGIGNYLGTLPPWRVLARAREIAGRPYNAATWNCEHFVRYCHGLQPESPQSTLTLL